MVEVTLILSAKMYPEEPKFLAICD